MSLKLSVYFVAPVLAWLVAQLLKRFLVRTYRESSISDLSFFFKSGNMPSSHAAIVVSLLTAVGAREGLDSSAFGIVFVLCTIVLYDAVNVRRSVGEQGLLLADLAEKVGIKKPFHRALGHRISEVAIGSLVGIVTAWVVLQFM